MDPLKPERWKRVEQLYNSALERAASERAAFLKQACEGDEALLQEVRSLLEHEEQAESFMEQPALEEAAELLAQDRAASWAGRRIGGYEVVSLLGAGGMGEVYRATDTELGRDVALKLLPEEFAEDRERLERFRREARFLAALSHPGIAAIHGLEESDGLRFLVLELVPGETLAERIARGPIPIAEALPIFRQVAEALEAAHEKGIVHRDLKPANVKITPEGRVKVLDFGLAKGFAGDSSVDDPEPSPTPSEDLTSAGLILGTPSYMSPEQARGKRVDRRTDIWAFGCVLYEALTGRKAFSGETASDTIVRILEHPPEWERLPDETPRSIRFLLQRSLEKDVHGRLQDIGDAGIGIEEALTAPAPSTALRAAARLARRARSWVSPALAVVAGAAILSLVLVLGAPWRTPATRRLAGPGTQSAEAYNLYLKGLYHWNEVNFTGMREALAYFERAIQVDPTYALPHVGLSDIYGTIGYMGMAAPRSTWSKAKAEAERALELDPGLAAAHAAFGHAVLFGDWDWPAAKRALDQAVALDLDYAPTYHWYAHYWLVVGNMEKALETSRRAVELKPLDMLLRGHELYFLVAARRPDELLERSSSADEVNPGHWVVHIGRGHAYQLQGRQTEAIHELERAVEASGRISLALTDLGFAYARAGRREDAERLISEVRTQVSQRGYSPMGVGIIRIGLGEKDAAFEVFEQGLLERAPSLLFLRQCYWYDDLRADPRYDDLVRRVGFPS